jgi:hypothetical protein
MDGLIMSSSGGDTFKMFISPVEPGENVAIGDFWAVQPSDDIVDELYIYDTDWQTVPFEYKEGSPPSDPSEGLYWALIGAGALRSIYQYRSGSWVNVSDGHNIFKSNNPPPKDGDLWIKTDTDQNTQGVYVYDSVNGWQREATVSTITAENVGTKSINFSSLSGTQWANTHTGGSKNISYGQNNTLTTCNEHLVGGQDNTATGAQNGATLGQHNTDTGYDNITAGSHNTNNGSSNVMTGYNNTNAGERCVIAGQNHNIANGTINAVVCGDGAVGGNGAFFVGNGGSNSAMISVSGYVYAAGYNTNGADYAEYFEWADGNPDGEDRRGRLVSLDGDLIRLADGDDIDGIVSVNPSVCGNDYELYWHGKYAVDRFGAVLRDEDGKAIISAEYDESLEYIPRSQRKEWSPIGLCGQMIVRDNGKCQEKDYVSARYGIGVPTTRNTRIKCLKRISNDLILCLIR